MFSPKMVMSPSGGSDRKGLDRSYTSASARAVAASSARRRSTNMFASGSSRRPSMGTGRSTPNRALQISQVTESGGNYNIEAFGTCLPALVMEALAYGDKNSEFSVSLSASGWAWLVAGRRLLIWRYRTETSWRASNHQFRELTLPPSDLAHRAQLVTVFSQTDSQVPSCVAVSPEGFVRYWPTITHEGSYQEISTDLQGQECDSIIFLGSSLGCLLATTTSTLLLIQPSAGLTGSSNINIRHLKAPSGILGGISKRVSSLVFGSMPTPMPEARLVGVLLIEDSDLDGKNVAVLSARTLQKWSLSNGEPDKLVYECNVDKFINEAFSDHVWGRDRVNGDQLQTWLISAQPTNNGRGIIILVAAVNSLVSQQLVYAFLTFDVAGPNPPTSVSRFNLIKHSEYYQDSAEAQILAQRFLVCGTTAYIYTQKTVLCVSATSSTENDVDRVEFSNAGDSILGAGRCNQIPIFFSTNNGVVSITPSSNPLNQSSMILSDSILDDTVDITSNLTCFMNPDEETASTDVSQKLLAAFLQYNKKNFAQANNIIEEIFPDGDENGLNGAVLSLSLKLIDDIPVSDPRWAEINENSGASSQPVSMTKSLLISNQVNDKIKAHHIFILFLQKTHLWERLTVTVVDQRSIQTRILLAEHAEQLNFTVELLNQHAEHQAVINAAIRAVLTDRDVQPAGRLSNSDVFYREISKIDTIVWGLIKAQDEVISADISPSDASLTIYNVNSILLALVKAARETKYVAGRGTRALMTESKIEYIPWTSSIGPRGMRSLLSNQHETTVEVGLARSEDGSLRGKLYTQIVELTDEILSGFQPHLSSLASINHARHQALMEEYQKQRYAKIKPLVKSQQYNDATNLAEKYCDFRTLIEICDITDNQPRMNQYMKQFKAQGFSDFVFRWYLETGKRGKLLSHGADGDSGNKDLTKFLQEYSSLAWLHQISSRDFSQASETLKDLALDEKSYLTRKKTLLSLAKLSGLAACENEEQYEDLVVSSEEELVALQEDLPKTILDLNCIDPEIMRVFSPAELVHMYTDPDNKDITTYDLQKAIEVIPHIDSDEARETLLMVWARIISRDNWDTLSTADPVTSLKTTVFCKVIDMAHTQGCCLSIVLPSAEELLSYDGLNELQASPSFNFLIRAAYEYFSEAYGYLELNDEVDNTAMES